MQIRDLGKIDAPVLLFGGVYGNLQALEALLDVAKTLGAVPVCTGDIVAYCAGGETCCQLFQRENIVTIAGNCERNLATGAADCGCGFEAGTACDRLSAAWFAHAQKTGSSRSLAWMRDLPDRITFSHAGRRYGVLHGALRPRVQARALAECGGHWHAAKRGGAGNVLCDLKPRRGAV